MGLSPGLFMPKSWGEIGDRVGVRIAIDWGHWPGAQMQAREGGSSECHGNVHAHLCAPPWRWHGDCPDGWGNQGQLQEGPSP